MSEFSLKTRRECAGPKKQANPRFCKFSTPFGPGTQKCACHGVARASPIGRTANVTEKLGLKLNERLTRLRASRIEYGFHDDLCVSFEISNSLGGFNATTEEEFAMHQDERQIGIFGVRNPVEALRALLEAYPDATILMRRDGKKRRTPRTSRVG